MLPTMSSLYLMVCCRSFTDTATPNDQHNNHLWFAAHVSTKIIRVVYLFWRWWSCYPHICWVVNDAIKRKETIYQAKEFGFTLLRARGDNSLVSSIYIQRMSAHYSWIVYCCPDQIIPKNMHKLSLTPIMLNTNWSYALHHHGEWLHNVMMARLLRKEYKYATNLSAIPCNHNPKSYIVVLYHLRSAHPQCYFSI